MCQNEYLWGKGLTDGKILDLSRSWKAIAKDKINIANMIIFEWVDNSGKKRKS